MAGKKKDRTEAPSEELPPVLDAEEHEPIVLSESSVPPPPEAATPLRVPVAEEVPPPAGLVRGRVWRHGAIEHDGARYEPGAELEVTAEVAMKLGDAFERS